MKIINKCLVLFSILALVGGLVFVPAAALAAPKQMHAEGQVLVKFKDGTDPLALDKAIAESGGKSRKKIPVLGVYVTEVAAGKEAKAVEKLSKNPLVEYAELDVWGQASSLDTHYGNQYGLENTGQTIVGQAGTADADIDAPEAWTKTQGNGVKVAVLDTGVDQDHEDLSSKVVLQKNFSTAGSVDDIYGHGTHVSGIIAAMTDNSTGVAGVCPGCQLMNGKVLRDDGYGAASWAANGIIWAADNDAKVINMSIGFRSSSRTMENAVKYAWNKGVVLVASAGNGGSQAKEYPGAFNNVIAVAATDNRDTKASFSTYGAKWVDITAPGVNVFSTFPNHPFTIQSLYGRSQNYDFGSGTSMSSPMVAGVAALVWSTSYGTSNSAVRSRVQSTADAIPGTGTYWANGRVNAARAVGY